MVIKIITSLFIVVILSNCSSKINVAGTYQSDLFSKNFILTTIRLNQDSTAKFWRIGDAFNTTDSGYYKVNEDTLHIYYSPPHFTAADRDSFEKYKILPFRLSQSEIESKSSDNFFLIRKNKLLLLTNQGKLYRKYKDKWRRVYFLKKSN